MKVEFGDRTPSTIEIPKSAVVVFESIASMVITIADGSEHKAEFFDPETGLIGFLPVFSSVEAARGYCGDHHRELMEIETV